MRRHDNTATWKWVAMKAVVFALVCLGAYVVFINSPEREAEGPALTREQLDAELAGLGFHVIGDGVVEGLGQEPAEARSR